MADSNQDAGFDDDPEAGDETSDITTKPRIRVGSGDGRTSDDTGDE